MTQVTNIVKLPVGAATEAKQDDIISALTTYSEASVDNGTATGGSNTTLVDTTKNWVTNIWTNAYFSVNIGAVEYYTQITSNTSNALTFPALSGGAIVTATDPYSIKLPVSLATVTIADGADITQGAKADAAQADPTQTASVIALLKGLLTQLNLVKDTDGIKKITDAVTITNIDIAISALRDSIIGLSSKSLTDLETALLALRTTSTLDTIEADIETGNTSLTTIAGDTTSLDDKTGEVQASPTANTILARLKDLLTGITLNTGSNNIGDVDVVSLPGTVATDITAIKTAVEIIDNAISGTEMQVDVVTSALPTGAATEAKQDTSNTSLSTIAGDTTSIDTKIVVCDTTNLSTSAKQDTGNASLSSIDGKITACNTGSVTISSSVIPTGAATEVTLSALNGKVTACNTGAVVVSSALPEGDHNIGNVDIVTIPALVAGSAIIGKVTTDQTTHGTTDKVAADLYQAGSVVATGNAVFVQPGTAASFTVEQATATNLKAQSELYVGGTAVSVSNKVPVISSIGSDFIVQLDYQAISSSDSYTRPADTTAYAENDAVSDSTSSPTVLTFASVFADIGKSIKITGISITTSVLAGTLPILKLWLFNASPTAINDNAAFTLSDAHNDTCVGTLTFLSSSTAVNNARFDLTGLDLVIKGAASTSLFGLIQVLNAYTPASGEVFTVTITGVRL